MVDFQSKYSGEQVEEILDSVANGEAGGGGGGITVETDPVFSASPAASITEAKKTEWDAKYTKPSGGIPASDLASDVFLQGEKGDKGDQGEQGIQGEQGPKGDDGADGEDGATFTPSVDANGNLSWTNNKGLSNPPTVNIKGPKGDSGEGGGGGSSSGSGAYPEVDGSIYGSDWSLGNYEIHNMQPNTFYVFPECVSLVIQFADETAGVANEYLFQFNSGATATSLTLPDDIKWTEELVIEPNRIYQISILKGLASVLSWENANTSSLIENHITYDAGNFMNGGTITFEYPTASELTFYMQYFSGGSLVVPQGSTQVNVTWHEPSAPIIQSIVPTEDSTYKYILP